METFKILNIKIDNFRSIEHLETKVGDKLMIKADNECGKSNFASAITWVLTGKNIENQSTFEIVPYGKIGVVSPSVELECLLVEDDRPITLKKEYTAKFTRDKQFNKYETSCFINGISVGIKEFQKYISENICNEEIYKLISVPKTFTEDTPKKDKELQWQAQRRLLMSLLPKDLFESDKAIAESDSTYRPLVEPLRRYGNINQYLTFVKKEKANTEKEINAFESKIEQQERNIIKDIAYTSDELFTAIEDVKRKISNLEVANNEYKQSINNSAVEDIRAEIKELQNERIELLFKYQQEVKDTVVKKENIQRNADKCKSHLDELLKVETQYRNRLNELQNTTITDKCPACGSKLPAKLIEIKKEDVARRIAVGNKALTDNKNQQLEAKDKYNDYLKDLQEIQEPVYPARAITIDEEINSLTNKILTTPQVENMEGYSLGKANLENELQELLKIKFQIEQNEKSESLIKELEEENSALVEKYGKIQYAIDLAKQFINYKCDKAESEINKLFTNIKFELFEKNKSNDDIRETCILKYNNIAYSELSLSTKLIANLELVNVFQRYYNIVVPIIIDNMETVTQPIENPAQLIMLKVQEERCPKCDNKSGRRDNATGLWTCQSCGHTWKKSLNIEDN